MDHFRSALLDDFSGVVSVVGESGDPEVHPFSFLIVPEPSSWVAGATGALQLPDAGGGAANVRQWFANRVRSPFPRIARRAISQSQGAGLLFVRWGVKLLGMTKAFNITTDRDDIVLTFPAPKAALDPCATQRARG